MDSPSESGASSTWLTPFSLLIPSQVPAQRKVLKKEAEPGQWESEPLGPLTCCMLSRETLIYALGMFPVLTLHISKMGTAQTHVP